jgi:hypothetical protein
MTLAPGSGFDRNLVECRVARFVLPDFRFTFNFRIGASAPSSDFSP